MTTGAPDRVTNLLGWVLVPMVVVMEFVDLRRGLDGRPAVVSAYLVGFSLLTLVLLPWTLRRLRELERPGRWMAGLFVLLMAYALATAFSGTPPVVQRRLVTREVMVVPPVIAVVTMLAALSLALVVRRVQLWVACWTVLVCSVLAWPRGIRVHNSIRLSTGMGGAAVYHVVLLCCVAFFLGCALQRWRPRASAAGAVVAAALVVGVGSRAGLACLLALGGLVAAWGLQQGLGRWVGRVAAAMAVAFALLLAVVPDFRRLFLFSEPRRQTNLHNSLQVWHESLHNQVFGVGSGHLWPWYALDTQLIPAPGSMMIKTKWGLVLNSPHSTVLAVLVELGVVGLVVLAAFCAVLVARLVRLWGDHDRVRLMVAAALCASLLAWLFDTYLLKNFGVAFWWWLMLFAVVMRPAVHRSLNDEASGRLPR